MALQWDCRREGCLWSICISFEDNNMFKVTIRAWFYGGVQVISYSTPAQWKFAQDCMKILGIKYDILCYMELEELITL